MSSKLFKDYVTPAGEDRIRAYKYKCQSDSFMYKYFMGPLANYSINLTPIWMAPNTITFIGFCFNILCHFLLLFVTRENLAADIPRWLCFLTGFCHFMYMNFDNMDGKQARRTNSSSPLGMLYDHGLDSCSGWIMALNMASILRIGNSPAVFYTLTIVPILGFFFTMWEEYHLDFLNFDFINPVDEGLTFMNSLIIFTGIVGTDFWLEEGAYGFKKNELLLLLFLFVAISGMIKNIFRVYKKYKDLKRSTEKLEVALYFLVIITIIDVCSPTNIVERRMRSLITCLGLAFCKVIGHIQLAHCAGDEFIQWRKSFLFTTIAMAGNALAGFIIGKCPIDEDLLLNLTIVFNFAVLLHYYFSMTQQLTRVLGIKVFSITKEKSK